MEAKNARPHVFVEHFFRNQWRNTVAGLTARFGITYLEDVENAVQAAMTKALELWTLSGVPDNPAGWIFVTARNALIDVVRRKTSFAQREERIIHALYTRETSLSDDPSPLQDDVLKMIFVCCHPRIHRRDSVILTLRIVCGLGFHEIASALYMSQDAVRKALTRCRHQIAERPFPFELPSKADRLERLGNVLDIVYLLFNEGYFATVGDHLTRVDLCAEAERLAALLRESHLNEDSRLNALSALLAFQSSRLNTRTDSSGQILRLWEQDRSAWNQVQIQEGFRFFEMSMSVHGRSHYHLEAAIAACHASAKSYEQTDWRRILTYYDDLLEMTSSPVVAMNRAVAVMMVEGPRAALSILERLEGRPVFKRSHLLPSLMAECHKRLGEHDRASELYRRSIELSSNSVLAEFWTEESQKSE